MNSPEQIVKQCRDASYGDYPWDLLLANIAEWVGGDKAILMHKAGVSGYNLSTSYNHDPDIERLYNQRYFHLDPRAEPSLKFDVGSAYTSQQIVPNSSYSDTEYYQDITLGGDIKDSVHGVISDDFTLGRRAISIQRGFKSEFFDQASLEKLRFVMSHLRRAFTNSLRLVPILARHEAADVLVFGLIDPAFHLHMVDGSESQPEEIFRIDPAIPRLVVNDETLAAALPDIIRRAGRGHRSTIRLANSNFSLSPVPRALEWIDRKEVALFVISAPGPVADTRLFATAFGLTDRESQILQQLVATQDREQICRELKISSETLRWHIKNILSKCGHSNGVDLVHAARNNVLSNRP